MRSPENTIPPRTVLAPVTNSLLEIARMVASPGYGLRADFKCAALLLLKLDRLDRIGGHYVMQFAAHILHPGFDRNELVGMIDGVGGLRVVRAERHQFRGRR